MTTRPPNVAGIGGIAGIAIVGMACRLPLAGSPAELWENVLAQRRAFRRIPAERLSLADFLADRADPDGIYAQEAAVLTDWEFDRVRFRVVGSTFRSADLAHWLALEVADRALADAGFPDGSGLPRAATGVLLGNSLTGEFSRANLMRLRWPYVRRVVGAALAEAAGERWSPADRAAFLARLEAAYKRPFAPMTEESLAGGLSNTIAGRVCNHFDLQGGGYTVDGACASSLLAVCQACSALAAGDLDVALAGGVDLSLDPFELVGFSRAGALADTGEGGEGEMRVYDLRSAGFVPGEGCGFAVLMREEDAARQGRRILAVVRGWGISSDGHGGISRPEAAGQALALERAYRKAGFGVDTVSYFEGHGTGTAVGDATELRALGLALSASAASGVPPSPLPAVGSVKANIGHTKAAAGLAGLLKATLAVGHQVLPPNTGCEEPHPELRRAGLRTLAEPEVWPADRPLRAGVSAMGFGGINSHVVIEGPTAPRRRSLTARERQLASSVQDAELLLLAAPDAAALKREVDRLLALAPRLARSELADLATTLARELAGGSGGGRGRLRAAVVAARPAELTARLETLRGWLDEGGQERLAARQGLFLGPLAEGDRPPRIGFLFPGQGSPTYLGGGAWRRRFAAVADVYARAERTGLPNANGEQETLARDTAVAQPAIVAGSLAGLAVLDLLGIAAVAGIGHSLGELAALAWAGAFGEEALLRIAAARGRAMAELGNSAGPAGSTGAMVAVAAGAETVAGLLAPGALLAAFNSPSSTVVSGEEGAVEEVLARARARGLTATRLKVSHAFHSPLVAAAGERLAAALASEDLAPLARRVASTVTGEILAPDADLRSLLLAQVTSPVRFTAALAALRGEVDLWLEVGPGRVLTDLVAESLPTPAIALDVGGPSLAGLLAAAGAAWSLGAPIDVAALFEGRLTRHFDRDTPKRFLANPCELAPILDDAAGAVRPPASTAVEPTARVALSAEPESAPAGITSVAGSPLEVVRQLVASRAELPASAVRDDSRLLSDLHLNSISVGQLVAEAARQLGLEPPASPSDYAQATVAQVAEALGEQAESGRQGRAEEVAPAGVDTWVRAFTIERIERPLRGGRPMLPEAPPAAPGASQVLAPEGHPLAASLAAALAESGAGAPVAVVAVCLPSADALGPLGEAAIELLLAGARAVLAAPPPIRFLVVQEGGGGGGFARTLHLELPQVPTLVVDLPFNHPRAASWVAAEAAAAGAGYTEASYDTAGTRRVPVLRLLPEAPEAPADLGLALGPSDVLLVTGGGKGIAAECALALARATGARVALLGRSGPADDRELAANLERFRAAGAAFLYVRADVTDPAAVRAAIGEATAALGPITGVLHGAGANHPRLLGELDGEAVRSTLAPKLAGAENLLAAIGGVSPDDLRLFVAFGSIIARTGMRGEADYALANEWLALWTERLGRRYPSCRCLTLEWSVWSGVGMGERLGRLAALLDQGIAPIPPDTGVALLQALLARPLSAASVVVAGRFGDPPTLEILRPELPLLRFLERPRVDYPGIELVVDTELSSGTDPYLEDHVFRGDRLLPAVMGLEAMAQAAMVLAGNPEGPPPLFERVELTRPVVVPETGSAVIRVAALVRGPGEVEAVLRTAATGFAVDHFRLTCRFGEPVGEPEEAPERLGQEEEVALRPFEDLYGGVLFHTGRFRRVSGYRRLSATECLAEISPDGALPWFGRYLPAGLVLGDPGVRDAAIHGIQACIPHATLLPVGVERILSGRIATDAPYFLAARERQRLGDTFVYDLEVRSPDGRVRERWQGLTLRAVDSIAAPAVWPLALLGPFLERRLAELLPGAGVRVALERRPEGGREASDAVLRRLLGREAAIRRRPDGRPEVDGARISVSHAGDVVLAIAGGAAGVVGCDLEPIVPRGAAAWRDLLGAERLRLAEVLAREGGAGEDEDSAATRVWAAAECLTKAGVLHGAPLVLADRTADGWQLLRSGDRVIGTLAAPIRELSGPAVVAVLVEG
jgi:enediyne polyketide synthase